MKVEWLPPHADPVSFDEAGGDHHLLAVFNASSTGASVITRKAPGQVGVSLIDRAIASRNFAVWAMVAAGSVQEFQERTGELVARLAQLPGEEFGTVRVYRDGLPTVEQRGNPVDSPRVRETDYRSGVFDIEWELASPLWEETADRVVLLNTEEGGAELPFELPVEFVAVGAMAQVENPGVPVPYRARIHGPCTFPELHHVNREKQFRIDGAIAEGSFIETDTGLGTVELVTGATRTNAFDRWDFDFSSPFSDLRIYRDSNTLEYRSASASPPSGISVAWRPAYAGL